MEFFDILLLIIHYIGIISFSAAGAMVAIDRENDLFGVIFLAVVTCFGGGLMRDVMCGRAIGLTVPAFFTNLWNDGSVIICIATAIVIFFAAMIFKRHYVKEEGHVNKINNVLDALGIGVFSGAGCASYISAGPVVAITMGLITSIGGGLLRDMILNDVPFVLWKRIYAVACLAGASVYYLLAGVVFPDKDFGHLLAMLVCLGLTFAIRMCATAFKWNMPRAINFKALREAEEHAKPESAENDSVKM
jgi:uncharacterized membrane protein YeiH